MRHFDEEQDPDPHRSELLDPDPHQNGKRDPDPDPTVVYLIRNTAFMPMLPASTLTVYPHTDNKENQIFLIYREIQSGAVAKSYMTNGLVIYGEIFSHFLIY